MLTSYLSDHSHLCPFREGTKAPDYSYATTQVYKGETNETGLLARKLGLTMICAGRNVSTRGFISSVDIG